jgi:predicted phage tail component-like protein
VATDTTFSIDGVGIATVADVDVLDVVRPFLPAPRDVRIDVPGRAGSLVYDEEPGDRELAVRCAYVASDLADRRSTIQDLAVFLYGTATQKIIVSDEPDRYWRGRLSVGPTPREILVLAEFALVWIVEPFALGVSVSTVTKTQTVAGAFGPASFTGGGDVKTPPSIKVTAGASGMVGGFVLNVNGTLLTYASNLAAFEPVTVSTVSSLVLSSLGVDADLTGAFDPDDVAMRDVSGDFGDIEPGSNLITITPAGSSNGASVSIDYRKRFLS